MDLKAWFTPIEVLEPSAPNKYNEHTFTVNSVNGRLIQVEEEVIVKDGEKIIAHAKFLCDTSLSIGTTVGGYKIISTKICYNKQNKIEFYRYMLI